MTYVRLGFVGAFLLLLVGGFTARNAVAPYFSSVGEPPSPAPRQTPTARVEARKITAPTPTAIVITATPTPAPPTSPTPTPTPRVIVVTAAPGIPRRHRPHGGPRARRMRAEPTTTATARPTHVPTATPLPTSTPTTVPTTGEVALSNYWVNGQTAHSGQTISIGYVIHNGTGHTERIMLGASLKPRSALSWTASISDPYHDVVAVVPPGATVHVRYFRLPSGLRPGTYDVAWGLRDAASGRRLGLAFAASVVTVTR